MARRMTRIVTAILICLALFVVYKRYYILRPEESLPPPAAPPFFAVSYIGSLSGLDPIDTINSVAAWERG